MLPCSVSPVVHSITARLPLYRLKGKDVHRPLYDPQLPTDRKELDALPIGILIRPSADSADSDWFAVALKVTERLWTVTGHGHVIQSTDLSRFAETWQIVFPSQLITV